jgi:hypothetical protein
MHPAQTDTNGQHALLLRKSFALSSVLDTCLRNAIGAIKGASGRQKLLELNSHVLRDIGEEDLAREKTAVDGPQRAAIAAFEKSLLRKP